jgi:hypothetical protein
VRRHSAHYGGHTAEARSLLNRGEYRPTDLEGERLVFDLAGVALLDCAGIRALSIAARLAPGGCPVVVRSLSPIARRIAELLDLDDLRELSLGHGLRHGPRDSRTGQQDFVPAEPGTAFLAGTQGCP